MVILVDSITLQYLLHVCVFFDVVFVVEKNPLLIKMFMTEVHLIRSETNAPCFMNKHFLFQLEYIHIHPFYIRLQNAKRKWINEQMNMHTRCKREKNASINKACPCTAWYMLENALENVRIWSFSSALKMLFTWIRILYTCHTECIF